MSWMNGMSQQNTTKIINPHDQFFRTSLANKQVAQEFLQTWLPKILAKNVNFDILEPQNRSFVDDIRKESMVDVLFKTKIKERDAYLYLLLEHQSTPDPLMPFRVLKYLCNVMDRHLKIHKTNKLPLVYPMVVYHGKQEYNYSNNIDDLVDAPKELVQEYFLKPFQLVDLRKIDDLSLQQQTWSGVMAFALKHIFARNILPHLEDMIELLQKVVLKGGQDYIEIVLEYLLSGGESSDLIDLFKLIDAEQSPEIGDKIMTIAELLRQEGRQEGKQEVAARMIAIGADPKFIVAVTGLSLDKIRALKKKSSLMA